MPSWVKNPLLPLLTCKEPPLSLLTGKEPPLSLLIGKEPPFTSLYLGVTQEFYQSIMVLFVCQSEPLFMSQSNVLYQLGTKSFSINHGTISTSKRTIILLNTHTCQHSHSHIHARIHTCPITS